MNHTLALLLCLTTPTLIIPMNKSNAQVHTENKQLLANIDSKTMQEVQNIDIDEHVDSIDAWINEEYKTHIDTGKLIWYVLSDKDIATIFNAIDKQIPGIPKAAELFEKLYAKNNFVKVLIDKYITDITIDIKNVTGHTIDKVGLASELLNDIPFWMKKYIMEKAVDAFYTDKTVSEYTYILQGHTDKINYVKLDITNEKIASCSKDTTARLWDIKTGNCDHILKHSDSVESCSYNYPDNSQLATTQNKHNIVYIWNTANGSKIRSIQFPVCIHHIDWQKGLLLAADNKWSCYLYNTTENNETFIKFFIPHQNMNLSTFMSSNDTVTACIKCIKDNAVILTINNPDLYFTEMALKNSENNYNALQNLERSDMMNSFSKLEGKQIRLNVQTKMKQASLTYTKK